MGWQQEQGDNRARRGDAGDNKAGNAEAVEERRGHCGVDRLREFGLAVEASAIGEVECAADGFVGGARELRSQFRGKRRGQSVVVSRGENTADPADTERASKQAG